MSTKIVDWINNRVDKEDSQYYNINKRRRDFWYSKSTTISCRIRDENDNINASGITKNIRLFLLDYDEDFKNRFLDAMNLVDQKDTQQTINYLKVRFSDKEEEYIRENIGLLMMCIPEEEKGYILNLNKVISCRLLGYEKEFFFLKCYYLHHYPVYIMRVLYHTNSEDIFLEDEDVEYIDFDKLLETIQFI